MLIDMDEKIYEELGDVMRNADKLTKTAKGLSLYVSIIENAVKQSRVITYDECICVDGINVFSIIAAQGRVKPL